MAFTIKINGADHPVDVDGDTDLLYLLPFSLAGGRLQGKSSSRTNQTSSSMTPRRSGSRAIISLSRSAREVIVCATSANDRQRRADRRLFPRQRCTAATRR